jgi:nitronate monooxygenase
MLWSPICEDLGITYPIMCAGMAGVTKAELAAAVSNAGGLGVIGGTSFTPEDLRAEIRKLKLLTERPFGVDLLVPDGLPANEHGLHVPDVPPFMGKFQSDVEGLPEPPARPVLTEDLAREQFEVVLEENVPLFAAGLGIPSWVVPEAHARGVKVLAVIGSLKHALRAEEAGVDYIVAQGSEAGGHVGQVGTFVLVPAVAAAVRVPVLAAGGIVNGRGIAAGMMLGAQGAWIGTRYLATPEAAGTPQMVKEKMLTLSDMDTVVTRAYTGKTTRVIRNDYTAAWQGQEQYLQRMPAQMQMVRPIVGPARYAGSLEIGNWPTGQGACMIREIKGAGEVTEELAQEAAKVLGAASRFDSPAPATQ